MSGVKRTVIVILCVITLIVGMVVARVIRSPSISPQQLMQMGAVIKQQQKTLADFSLTDHRGGLFDNDRLKGQWSLIFFGYTYCPDVCPTTMALLNQLSKDLQGSSIDGQMQYILASVDPERDTPEQLSGYLGHFNPEFIGITGDVESIYHFAMDLNSIFAKVPMDDEGNYLMDHSANIAVINPAGEYHGFLRSPHNIANMNGAIRAIVKAYP